MKKDVQKRSEKTYVIVLLLKALLLLFVGVVSHSDIVSFFVFPHSFSRASTRAVAIQLFKQLLRKKCQKGTKSTASANTFSV